MAIGEENLFQSERDLRLSPSKHISDATTEQLKTKNLNVFERAQTSTLCQDSKIAVYSESLSDPTELEQLGQEEWAEISEPRHEKMIRGIP